MSAIPGPRIAYVMRGNFFSPSTGGRVKTAAMASALAAAGELTVIDLSRERMPGPRFPAGEMFALPYGGQARLYSSLRANRPWLDRLARRIGWLRDPAWLYRTQAGRRRAVVALLQSLQPDVLVVDHPANAAMALAAPARVRILHTHNLESELAAAGARETGKRRLQRRAEVLRRLERELLPRFDQVWGVREEDLAVYRQLGVSRCVLAPNVVPDAAFAPAAVAGAPGEVLMVGSLNYGPNAGAARYLVELGERQAAAGAPLRITIAGRGADDALLAAARRHAWLHLPGFTPDLQPMVDRAAVIAVPLAWGAGTKVKVVEALARGKPLVTTPVGAEGLAIEDGVHALVRAPGAEFDAALLAVAREPAAYMDMARRGRELAWARYSQTALTRTVTAAVGEALARTGA